MADRKPSKDELMKAVAEVLDEAIETFERLEKMDGMGIDAAQAMPDPSKGGKDPGNSEACADGGIQGGAQPAPPKGDADTKADGVKGPKEAVLKDDMEGGKPPESKDGDSEEDEEKKRKKKDMEDMDAFKSMAASLEKRGLIQKSEPAPAPLQKSEPAPDKVEELRKSFAESVDALTKQMSAIAEKVEKIASSPAAPRRGLSGATPLRKSGDGSAAPSYTKLQALDKLLELRKSGDERVDTSLINRVELGRLVQGDVERLSSILG